MKTCMRIMSVIALLTFASSAWAQSPTLSLGYVDSGSLEVDIDHASTASGTVNLYCNGNLVFSADLGGVTYLAPGVSYNESGALCYALSGLPAGNYTADFTGLYSGSYWTDYYSISWVSSGGTDWFIVSFLF